MLLMEIEEGVMEVTVIKEEIEMTIVLMKMIINFQEIKEVPEDFKIKMEIKWNKVKAKRTIIKPIKINIKNHKMQTKKIMNQKTLLILMKIQKIKFNKIKIISKINLLIIMFNKINSKIHIQDFRIWWRNSKTVNNKIKQIKSLKVIISKLLKTITKQDHSNPKLKKIKIKNKNREAWERWQITHSSACVHYATKRN